jgi:hypothetical protein
MAQINIAASGDKSGVQRPTGNKVNGQRTGPIQASIQRIARPPEARKDPVRRAEQPPRVTRFNVPAPDASAQPPLQQGTWLRPLVVGLILVALIPNVTLAAVLWLGLIDPPWARQETPPPAQETQTAAPAPVLTAPATLEATAGETIKFPIALDNTDGVPARSVIAIQGLPAGSTLSDGRPYGDEWNLKSDQIGDLHLALPQTAHGEMQIAISLVTADNTVFADTETVLTVAPAPDEPQVQSPIAPPAVPNAELQQTSMTAEPNEDDGAAGAGDVPSSEQTSGVSTAAPAPEAPAPTGADANPTEFVRPSAYVNLRAGPSSSSSVIGVIAKGTKLAVLDRKRGWVQVTDPATSKEGWIYSGYVGGGSYHARPRKKAVAPPEQKADSSSSFWKWLLQ